MKKSKFSPPKPTIADNTHLAAKTIIPKIEEAISSVQGAPNLGLSKFLFDIFPSPLEKRKKEWMEYIGNFLEENFGEDLDNLKNNEKFITVLIQATRIAIQNHQKEKLDALRNSVVSSVYTQDISEDLQLTFIRFIDELTPSHILLLKFFVQFERELEKIKSYPELLSFFHGHYEYSNALYQDEFKMFVSDLNTRGLVRISQDIGDFNDIYIKSNWLREDTNDAQPRIIVTSVTKDFIRFITEIDSPKPTSNEKL